MVRNKFFFNWLAANIIHIHEVFIHIALKKGENDEHTHTLMLITHILAPAHSEDMSEMHHISQHSTNTEHKIMQCILC